jgi:hypothetical protein
MRGVCSFIECCPLRFALLTEFTEEGAQFIFIDKSIGRFAVGV